MRPRHLAFLALVALSALFSLLFFREEIGSLFRAALDWIRALGPLGPLLFMAIYVLACVLMLPASVLTLGGGAIWGLWAGVGMVLASATAGAAVTFLLGRHVARGWIEAWAKRNPRFGSLDRAIGKEGWRLVLLTRLSPVIPFNLLNYSLGITSVRFSHYLAATSVGMIPGVFLYTYLGTLAGQAATAGDEGAGALVWSFRIAGLLATAGVTVYVTRLARKALAGSIGEAE